MIGTITHILSKAGYKSMNGPLADERRRLSAAVAPAAYVSYDPRLLAGAGWYGYRISFKGGDRSMLERARYLLGDYYLVREMYDNYADGIYSLGVLLRQRVPHYGIGGGQQQEPDALNFTMPDGGTITLTRNGTPIVVELEYSLDGGATWQIWEEVGNVRSLTLAAGQTMFVRNTSETQTGFGIDSNNYYQFGFSSNAYPDGNVNSLLCKDPSLVSTLVSGEFNYLFYGSINTITTPRLPAKTIASSYYRMFGNCTNLTLVRSLDIENITGYGGMREMFRYSSIESLPPLNITGQFDAGLRGLCYNCSNLNKIILNVSEITANNFLLNWLDGVAPTGDFYCPSTLTIPTGASGIPTGWTRHDI